MIALVPFGESHLDNTFHWLSSKRLQVEFLLRRNISYEEHVTWFEHYKADESQKIFAIEYDGLHCGNCGFKLINHIDSKAELWIYLGESYLEGKGIAFQSLTKLVNIGFSVIGLRKIYLHVADFNTKALSLYRKFGFQEEGKFVNDFFMDNQYINVFRLYIAKVR